MIHRFAESTPSLDIFSKFPTALTLNIPYRYDYIDRQMRQGCLAQ